MGDEQQTRRYRKRKRAILEAETRQRITEVVVDLHGTVGPANTTVTAIAERAGVSRMTVYNHFPDDEALFAACSSHWFARHPFPDPDTWIEISDPAARLLLGLGQVYRWYRGSGDMMDNVLRDAPLVPAVGHIMDAAWWPFVDRMADALAEGWLPPGDDRLAAIRTVLDFRTWRILAGSGLDDGRASTLAVRMVHCGNAS